MYSMVQTLHSVGLVNVVYCCLTVEFESSSGGLVSDLFELHEEGRRFTSGTPGSLGTALTRYKHIECCIINNSDF